MTANLTKSEFALWNKIQMENLEREMKISPDKPISQLSQEAHAQFLSEKWICHVEPGKFPIEIERYQEINKIDGPDLTRIPRSRYHFLSRSSKSEKGPKKVNAYSLYFQEQAKLLTDVPQNEKMTAIGQKWSQLSDDIKEEYKLKAQKINDENLK